MQEITSMFSAVRRKENIGCSPSRTNKYLEYLFA
jgi:hypothetical protein